MATIGWSDDCPHCGGEGTLACEQRHSNQRMECRNCGYFYECIDPWYYEDQIPERVDRRLGVKEQGPAKVRVCETSAGILYLDEDLHRAAGAGAASAEARLAFLEYRQSLIDRLRAGFKRDRRGQYVRAGVFKEPAEPQGQLLVINAWFDSASPLQFDADWYDDPTCWPVPVRGEGWDFRGEQCCIRELSEENDGTNEQPESVRDKTGHSKLRMSKGRRRRGHPLGQGDSD